MVMADLLAGSESLSGDLICTLVEGIRFSCVMHLLSLLRMITRDY